MLNCYPFWPCLLVLHRPGFFPGGFPIRQKFCQSPLRHLSPFLDQGLSPPPAEVRPPKFEKFKYIFVSNLTKYFQAQKYLRKLYFMLKIAKNSIILHKVGSFGFSRIFSQVPPPIDFVPIGDEKILSPPHQKFREKNPVDNIHILWSESIHQGNPRYTDLVLRSAGQCTVHAPWKVDRDTLSRKRQFSR